MGTAVYEIKAEKKAYESRTYTSYRVNSLSYSVIFVTREIRLIFTFIIYPDTSLSHGPPGFFSSKR